MATFVKLFVYPWCHLTVVLCLHGIHINFFSIRNEVTHNYQRSSFFVIFLLDVGKASAFFVSFLCAWNTKFRLHFGMRVLFSPFVYFIKIQNKYLMGEQNTSHPAVGTPRTCALCSYLYIYYHIIFYLYFI